MPRIWKRELRNQDGRVFGQEWTVQTYIWMEAFEAVARATGQPSDVVIERTYQSDDVWDQFRVLITPQEPTPPDFCPDCPWEEVQL